jgi:ADP-heptose:LPS heptosyltransferase
LGDIYSFFSLQKKMEKKNPKKFLVIRFSSIGDIVLTSPVLRCLHQQYPDAEIHFLTKVSFKNIIINNPYISNVHYYKGKLGKLIHSLKAENFDAVIDLQKNGRSRRIRFSLGKKYYTFEKLNFQKWLLVNFKINRLPDKHIVDRYFEAVSPLGVQNDGKGLDFFINNVDEVRTDIMPEKFHSGYVAFVIGGTYPTKKLPNKKIISIIQKIDLPVVLLGGSLDLENSIEIKRALGDKVYNAVNKFGVSQSASIIANAKHVISHDTGLMHIAAAFKKPLVSVWGNTTPEFGMSPYFGKENESNSVIVEVEGLNCRPCSKLGFKKCPRGHFKCMNLINEQEITDAVNSATSKLNAMKSTGN